MVITTSPPFVTRFVIDPSGVPLGKITDFSYGGPDHDREWMTVDTGSLLSRVTVLPTSGCSMDGDDVVVPWTVRQVRGAPRVKVHANGTFSEHAHRKLCKYYAV